LVPLLSPLPPLPLSLFEELSFESLVDESDVEELEDSFSLSLLFPFPLPPAAARESVL
jgi:hypothetical protein